MKSPLRLLGVAQIGQGEEAHPSGLESPDVSGKTAFITRGKV
jgi:hypothetical protein